MYREQQGVLVTHPLDFEPTSIAVLPQGTQIAVGGKVKSQEGNNKKTMMICLHHLG